ncbi:SusC/RagA family TonB-linked outer membrane protein [Chitinophaga agrisoli]|uniref:SusC/RagA family TonB-linked outer membrane protein n=1 Tax=Chitinophaga agrisoli TaxID=2607653 RepID=A0A5B2VXM9_9BACT|nr:SusC/RagA family TonB-linked outer membrane protein [Chitinophaga agrisoli]KAA2243368.1 SusC/RagA family TonB-linked outer membrane protein [Chitinophaga agrisoli]
MKKWNSTYALLGILAIYCLFPLLLRAQSRADVTGIVRSEEEGVPLWGVSVTVKNATNNFSAAVQTDSSGVFTFNRLPAGAGYSFTFSFIGFETQIISGYTLKAGADFSLRVQLKNQQQNMNEVVVVGYGTMQKKDLTGAISQLKTAKLQKESPRSVQDLLRSGIPGLSVQQNNAAKGGGEMQVRGQRSLKASNDPLIVLDGVIFFGELSEINPQDIEHFDVLKDASAAAIYGAKSANGVVIITTKKGATDKPTIRFDASTGVGVLGKKRPVYDAQGYLNYRTDLFNSTSRWATPAKYVKPTTENLAKYGISMDDWLAYDALTGSPDDIWLQRIGLFDKERANYAKGQTYDWFDHSFQHGLQQNYNVSFSGRHKDAVNYYMSLGYLNNEGIVVGDKYRAYRGNIKLDGKVNKWMHTGVNINFQDRTDRDPDNNDGNLVTDWKGQIINNSPFALPYDSNGILDPYPMGASVNHGTSTAYNNQYKQYERGFTVLNTTLYQTIKLPFNISYQLNFSPRMQWFYYRYHESALNPLWTDNGKVVRENEKKFDWQIDNIISWDYTFAKKHSVKVTLLQNAEEHRSWEDKIVARDFSPTDALGFHNVGAGNPLKTTVSSDDRRSTGDALMARLFYSYDNRYMLTASIRRDGYSAFGASNPRATFPSLAFAWNFANESFFHWAPMSTGKLRLSWGMNGNRSIDIYQALSNLTTGTGRYPYVQPDGTVYELSQLYVDRMANYNLKWEATSAWNIGLDFGFLKNRITGNLEFYNMPTTDLLMDQNLPDFTGFTVVTTNLGEVVNKGFELGLTSLNMDRKNFEWTTTFNLSANRNQIKHLYYTYEDVVDANGKVTGSREIDDISNKWFIGHDIATIWDYKVQGIWQESEREQAAKYGEIPGDVKVEDVNGDGKYTNEDKQFLGYTTPRFRWGLRNDFTLFRNFEVSFNMYANWGHKAISDDYLNNFGAGTTWSSSYVRKYWTPDHPSDTYARLNSTNVQNITPKRAIDKTYIRLDNVSISYSLPTAIARRLDMSQFKIYAGVRNAIVWARKWEYWDPETTDLMPRYYTVGLTATF